MAQATERMRLKMREGSWEGLNPTLKETEQDRPK